MNKVWKRTRDRYRVHRNIKTTITIARWQSRLATRQGQTRSSPAATPLLTQECPYVQHTAYAARVAISVGLVNSSIILKLHLKNLQNSKTIF